MRRLLERSVRNPPPAVVIGSGSIAIAVARTLAQAGVSVHGWGDAYGPACSSRYYGSFANSGRRGATAAASLWARALEGPREGVVIPCTDDGVELVSTRRSELAELGYGAMRSADAVSLAMLDKAHSYRLAAEHGIGAPRTISAAGEAPPDPAAAGISFPCAVKPLHAHRFARYFDGRDPRSPRLRKLFVVADGEELEIAWRQMAKLDLQALVSEIVPGPDTELFGYFAYFGDGGEPLVEYTNRKLRQYPPWFGLASASVSCEDADVAEAGRTFLREIGYVGPAHVEFKRAPDGNLKLIECNPRLTIELRHSPADLPRLVYEEAAGVRLRAPSRPHRPAARLWDPLADLRSLPRYGRSGEWSLVAWARSLWPPPTLHVFDLGDPMPTLGYHARILQRHWNRILARISRIRRRRVRAPPRQVGSHWDTAVDSCRKHHPLAWRHYCDALHARLIKRWLGPAPLGQVLKTDLFDEALGDGLTRILSAPGNNLTAVDISPRVVEMALRRHPGIDGVCADIRFPPFAEESFDLIVSNSTLDHLESHEEIDAACVELARLLRPGGRLLLTLDNFSNPVIAIRSALPRRLLRALRITPFEAGPTYGPVGSRRALHRAGLEVRETTGFMHCPRVLAVAAARFLERRPRSDSRRSRFVANLMRWEALEAHPTRYLSGHYVAILAVKPQLAERSQEPTAPPARDAVSVPG